MSGEYVYRYNVVFRPGSGIQYWWVGSDLDQLKATDSDHFQNGLRIVAADRHKGRHFVVWRPGDGGQRWITGVDVDGFKEKDAGYFAQGLRLEVIDTDVGGLFGGTDFLGVWRSGTGGQHWYSGMSIEEFSDKLKYYFQRGYRLQSVDIDSDGKIAAVWRPGTGGEYCWKVNSLEEFKAHDKELAAKGYRLQLMDRRLDMWMGVWKQATGVYYWYYGLTLEEFKAKEQQHRQEGLRIQCVDLARILVTTQNDNNSSIILRVDHSGTVTIDNVSFSLTRPDGQQLSASAGNVAQATIELPPGYVPFGNWKVGCTVNFHSNSGTQTLSTQVQKNWAAGKIATWSFELELQAGTTDHYTLVGE
jgi:hypothetical protein